MQLSESSIIVDASKYIQELKHKVERLNEDITTTTTPQTNSNNKTSSWPVSFDSSPFLDSLILKLFPTYKSDRSIDDSVFCFPAN